MAKKVFVSGCFDMLHSGHVEFFKEASAYGDLHVALGSDRTIFGLKGRPTINSEQERLFMVRSISFVHEAFISQGSGVFDFEKELRELKPDTFIVNQDGHVPEKQALCEKLGIEYIVLDRKPHPGLETRSTTDLRQMNRMPFRIDLAGGWLDQPYVSEHHPGSVITISLEPTIEFNERSGMASSTRRSAIDLWGPRLPVGNYEKLAKTLFCYDNPPGTRIISGSQDSIGIVFPGLAKAFYEGKYWPTSIEHVRDESLLSFVERSLQLISLGPRYSAYDVLADTRFNRDLAKALADAADHCWDAIMKKDLAGFGRAMRASFEAQVAMFPHMMNERIAELIEEYRGQALGWKLSGAGGGGYLILVADTPVKDSTRVVARRELD